MPGAKAEVTAPTASSSTLVAVDPLAAEPVGDPARMTAPAADVSRAREDSSATWYRATCHCR